MNFGNVVWMNIYLTDEQDVAGMNEVYWQTIGQSPPARAVLTVAALPDGERVEINCIAVADTIHREADLASRLGARPARGSACNQGR